MRCAYRAFLPHGGRCVFDGARRPARALYPDAVPERGSVVVTMSLAEEEGTTGVIAQVFTLLTGAAANNGFHGIGGRYARHDLLRYGSGDSS